ncbi:hypothetical protein [Micromonospora humi]|uniref:Uncharacterized protein n=1 Tax=Micromonospora humi TaxID=745366 RepID=A0A1C5HF16_9ACTN|nr:hypothetical protein [Micromonospora humi]SCG44606.1 hypothetical protein GA0070213_10332 [Micromonospora humi]
MPHPYRTVALLSAPLLVATGCTSRVVTSPPPTGPASATTVAPAPASAAPTVPAPPSVAPGEVSRVVWTAGTGRMSQTMRAKARAGQEYALDAACASTTPGKVIRYELHSATPDSNTPLSGGDLPCDGRAIRNSGPLPATAVQIRLGSDLTGVTSAWAVLRPVT